MKSFPLLLSLALLAGCGQKPDADTATPPVARAPAQALESSTLAAYHWQLASAQDVRGESITALFVQPERPVQLDFGDGRISIGNTCNRMNGGYSLAAGKLVVERLASTLMACTDARLTALDGAVGQLLQGPLDAALRSGDTPLLSLTTAAGDILEFNGRATAETRYGGPGERVFLEVAAQRVDCHHPLMPEHRCLSVREIGYDDKGIKRSEGEWQPLYDEIEGYEHSPGTRNVLRLKRFSRDPAPADASAHAYVLDMVVESERVDP